ncbi:hypothetical protein L2E82_26634 [Cichorium intybus]|uniref:Uncharacterized protein n=1 Tax=Cichorium intybus TaxID=13427 RepID=A0ACB9CQT7_CICIN|nr:hypothetical protein L2E82_26634 [Cichorium intybus]
MLCWFVDFYVILNAFAWNVSMIFAKILKMVCWCHFHFHFVSISSWVHLVDFDLAWEFAVGVLISFGYLGIKSIIAMEYGS